MKLLNLRKWQSIKLVTEARCTFCHGKFMRGRAEWKGSWIGRGNSTALRLSKPRIVWSDRFSLSIWWCKTRVKWPSSTAPPLKSSSSGQGWSKNDADFYGRFVTLSTFKLQTRMPFVRSKEGTYELRLQLPRIILDGERMQIAARPL